MARPGFVVTRNMLKGAYEAAKRGLTDEEIARAIKVRYSTFRKYKSEFMEEIERGRQEGLPVIVDDLQNALLKKAMGFEFTERHVRKEKDGQGKWQDVERKEVRKYYPPSDVLLIFALCNLAPARYRSVNRVNEPRNNENEPTVEEIFAEMATHTPTPYAIPPSDYPDKV